MGHCTAFNCQIAPGCDQPMEAHEDRCSCPECGAVCTGLYDGCPDVWASATVALVPTPRRRERKRRKAKAAARNEPVPATPATWNAERDEDVSVTTPSNGDAVPINGDTVPTNGNTVPSNSIAAPANGDTDAGGNGEAVHDPDAEFDEGIELLRAALEDIHHERERLEEPRGLSGTSRARRPRADTQPRDTTGATEGRRDAPTDRPYRERGKRNGNGNGNGKSNGNGNGTGNAAKTDKRRGWRGKQRSEPAAKPVPARRRGRDRTPASDSVAVDHAKADPGTRPEPNADVLKAAAAELARHRDQSAPPPAPPSRAEARAPATKADLATPRPAPATRPKRAAPKRAELPPPTAPTSVAAAVPATRPRSTDRRRKGIVVAAVLAAVALVAGGVVAMDSLRGGDSSNETATPRPAPTSSRLELGTFAVVDGVEGERVWTLNGKDGTEFEGTLTFANETDAPIAISHTEIIPKSLAASVDQIRFSPQPIVIDPDPVVQYDLTVAADDTVTARYSIEVPADGAERSRLADWASDLQDEQRRRGAPVTTVPTLPGDAPSSNGSGGGGNGNKPSGGSGNKPSGGSAPKPAAPPAGGAAPAPPPPPPTQPPPPPAASGTIVIRVVSYEGTGTFGFSGPGGGQSVGTAGSPNGSGQSAAMSVAPGTYAWTQVSLAPGYHLQVIDCTDRDAGPFEQRSTVSGATATFNVQPGESVTCTWINRR